MKLKNISIFLIFLINISFLAILFFTNCNYFRLLNRKEWEELNNNEYISSYLYVVDNDRKINHYRINYNNSGNLEYKDNFSLGTLCYPNVIDIDKSNNFLYIPFASPDNKVVTFLIKDDGKIEEASFSPQSLSITNSRAIAIDPFSRFAYIAYYNSTSFSRYIMNKLTGELTNTLTTGTGSNTYTVDMLID